MNNIDIYYESLRQVYDQILSWEEPKPRLRERIIDWLVGITGVAFALSVIPILPAILMLLRGHLPIVIGPLDTTQGTFGAFALTWIASVIISALLFFPMLWVNDKVDASAEKPDGPPQTLSPEQLTFISVYEAYKELKVYFVSHIDQHVDKSLAALRKIIPRARWAISSREMIYSSRELERMALMAELDAAEKIEFAYRTVQRRLWPSFPAQVSVAHSFLRTFEGFAWFQLDPTTKSTLQALISFPQKVPIRLREREDLPAMVAVLENMSKFTYAFLPEHATYLNPEEVEQLQSEGLECLKKFVQQVNDLTQYSAPPDPTKETEDISKPSLRDHFQRFYLHNVFFRFTLWFVLILLLTSGAVFLFNQYIVLSPDTMAALVIGTSVASAATLAAFLPRSSTQD
jgi:hypothetical protein